eukprot:SAG11_NODE_2174_length_3719_cov_4.843094_2_plen_65_part_00
MRGHPGRMWLDRCDRGAVCRSGTERYAGDGGARHVLTQAYWRRIIEHACQHGHDHASRVLEHLM